MIIKEAIYALTGYEGTDGKSYFETCERPGGCCGSYYQRQVSPEEQKERWTRYCLWTESAIAGFFHSVSSSNSFPGTVMNIAIAALMAEHLSAIKRVFRVDSRLHSIVEGAYMGGLLLQNDLGGHIPGAVIGAGCGAFSKVAFTIANIVRDHAEYRG